ncbi:MAG TPA: hypothetical protein VKZ96_05915, partial [Thermomicrobiales bacterium]|nr:hypothetical protein [Thermomicrobiales bacterium]
PGAREQSDPMRYFRIYADENGESHFEDVDIELEEQNPQSELSRLYPAIGVIFRRTPADQFIDWHPAPRRQFVVTLSGEAEIEASDGEVRRIGPGTIMLAEDVTGKGHITRGIGTEERLSLFIPLPDQGEAW